MDVTKTLAPTQVHELRTDSALQSTTARVVSIDILRAITMVLMIFVNDLWSLQDIPLWLEHVPRGVDGMGLADTIFPAFLFIVGMSIPLAVAHRRKKGDSNLQLLLHIGSRTLALLVMGVFLVNGENIHAVATGMPRVVWYTLSCLSFILIWNVYPKTASPWLARTGQGIGIAILLILALVFRGGEGENINRFSIYWWGILGLIGWSYLVGSLITAFSGKKYEFVLAAWVLFCVLSMVSSANLISEDSMLSFLPNPVVGGTLPAFTLGGVLTTLMFQHFRKQKAIRPMMLLLLVLSAGLIVLGVYTRTFWGIAKLGATPAWLFICSAFTILAFMVIYALTDWKGKAHWFRWIRPAGTDTLLCYLMPYFAYAGVSLLGIHWPEIMLTGAIGLLKSFVFALLCVWVAGFLSRKGIRLKL